MNLVERLLISSKHEEPDKVPFVPLAYSLLLKSYACVREASYYEDLSLQLKCKLAFIDRFPEIICPWGSDFVFPEVGGVGLIPTAFGGRITWIADAPPWVSEYPIKNVEDIERIISLGIPDPKKIGISAHFLEALRYFYDWFPKDVRKRYEYIDGNVGESLLIEGAMLSMGYDKFFVFMFQYPKELHRFLDLVTKWFLEFYRNVEEITGEPKYVYMPDHSPSFVSKDQFLEFILPYMNRVWDHYQGVLKRGGLRIWHNEGKVSHMLDAIDKINAEVWQFGAFEDPVACKKNTHFCLMGNLHPPGILLKGTPKEVFEYTKELIFKVGGGGGLWVSSGGGIAPDTPFENLEAVLKAIEEFGRYPLKQFSRK
ncbi:MAG: uroporphyrinogen decarboxylase family protein [Nitrososphaerales archaeon]